MTVVWEVDVSRDTERERERTNFLILSRAFFVVIISIWPLLPGERLGKANTSSTLRILGTFMLQVSSGFWYSDLSTKTQRAANSLKEATQLT